MTSPDDEPSCLALDASAVINLLATGMAEDFLRALNRPCFMADKASREVRRHPIPGRHIKEMMTLVERGMIAIEALEGDAHDIFFALVSAEGLQGLDDGEAATIALSIARGAAPVLDDRKARSVFKQQWPRNRLLYTIDLFGDRRIAEAMSKATLGDAIYMALSQARMCVPSESRAWVVDLVGADRALKCRSLGPVG